MTASGAASPVVLVTGAAGGLGRAVVARLRERAMRVWATDLTLAEIPCGAPMGVSSLDVTDAAAIKDCVARIVREWGRIDHVVHLAGRAGQGPLDRVALEEWDALLAVNLTSAFLIAQATHAALASTRGSLVLTSSTNGLNGGSALSGPAYAVAKAGIINLARFLARDWASAGVRVNCIAPGPVDTVMLDRLGAAGRARLLKTIPLGRFSSAEQVAAQVAFLLSDDCAAVSGEVFNTSGALVLD